MIGNDSYPIFPFYVVIDVSISMRRSLDAINDELPKLKRDVEEDPIVGDIARFGVITFSDEAEMVLPLSDLLEVPSMPVLRPLGGTDYRDVFELLSGAIPHDMNWFKANGAQVYRPAVFFITDGHPNEENWEGAHRLLVDPASPYRPNIVAFGFGDVEDATIARIATFKAYAADAGESPSEILRQIAKDLTNSIMRSSRSAAAGEATLAMPAEIQGMHEIPIDLV